MSSTERRFAFLIDDQVGLDLLDMASRDPDQAAALIVLLEEMKGDRRLCERLIDAGYEDQSIISVKPFSAMQRQGYNTYTVKFWEAESWRVITAVDYKSRTVGVLYIMLRSEDYDSVVQKHVKEAFERLDFSRLGR